MKTTAAILLTISATMLTSCAPASIVSGASYWCIEAREADRLSPNGEYALAVKVKQMIDDEGRKK